MSTYSEITNQVADQWVAVLNSAADAVTKAAESTQRVTEAFPVSSLPFSEPLTKLNEALAERLPQPREIVEANFEVTNKLLTAQRDLTLRLLEASTASLKTAQND
jgi:hypothetical protein